MSIYRHFNQWNLLQKGNLNWHAIKVYKSLKLSKTNVMRSWKQKMRGLQTTGKSSNLNSKDFLERFIFPNLYSTCFVRKSCESDEDFFLFCDLAISIQIQVELWFLSGRYFQHFKHQIKAHLNSIRTYRIFSRRREKLTLFVQKVSTYGVNRSVATGFML